MLVHLDLGDFLLLSISFYLPGRDLCTRSFRSNMSGIPGMTSELFFASSSSVGEGRGEGPRDIFRQKPFKCYMRSHALIIKSASHSQIELFKPNHDFFFKVNEDSTPPLLIKKSKVIKKFLSLLMQNNASWITYSDASLISCLLFEQVQQV